MLLGTWQKDVVEKDTISVDFAPVLTGAETITDAEVTVIKRSDGGDGAAILNGARVISGGTKVLQPIAAGTAGESYTVQVKGIITATKHKLGHVRIDVFDY